MAAFKYARTIGETAPLSEYLSTELNPGTGVQSDDDWATWIKKSVSTEYHPASTCSMLPEDAGGVVDAESLVYGISNLRIVDSSIVPVGLSAHMTAPLYGIAERIYGIMAGLDNTTTTSTSTSSATSSTSTSTKSKSKSSTKTSTATSAATAATTTAASSGTVTAQLSGLALLAGALAILL